MPTFPDLARFEQSVDQKPLVLPVRGKSYAFPPDVPLRAGLTLARLREQIAQIQASRLLGRSSADDEELLDDFSEATLIRQLIGDDMLDEMETDGLQWSEVERVGKTLIHWHLFSEQSARAMWEGLGEASPPAQGSSSSPRTTSPSGSTTSKRKRSKTKRPR